MSELTDALETIRPELMTVTRLFGMDESVWADPPRYSYTAADRTAAISSLLQTEGTGRKTPPPFRMIRIPGSGPCTGGGLPAGCASRPCTTCAAKPPASIRPGAA